VTLVTTLVIGLSLGAVYALLAAGVTVVYQAVRIPNVAVVAIGTVAAVLHGDLMSPDGRTGSGMSWWSALAVAVGVAAVLGLLCDLLTRGLREQIVPALVALLGLSALLLAGVNVVWGSEAKLLTLPSATRWGSGDLEVARSDVITLILAVAIGVALTVFLRRTRLGLALRAQGNDTEGARQAGVDPAIISRVAWVLSSVLGAVAMTLALPPLLVNTYDTPIVYAAFAVAAAAVGGFRSLPRAVLAGMILGVVPTVFEPRDLAVGGIGNLVAFLILAGVLFRRPGMIGRPVLDESFSSAPADNAPSAARRRAALTTATAALPTGARRALLAGLAVVLAVVVPALSNEVALDAWARGIAIFLISASIVIMSGWTGELPLGQVAFAGIGAYLVGGLSNRAGLPHFAAIPLAALAALPYALALGIPAFRSRGRLAFAALSLLGMVLAATLLWGPGARWFTGRVSISQRPGWMEVLSGRPEASYYLVALVLAAGVVWFATNLRRSRIGRALAAARDSDAATRSLGIDPAHYRLVALSFSAVVAALGGILLAYGEKPLDPTRFAVFLSVQYFLYTVVGGTRSLAGAAVVVFAFEIVPALGQGAPPTGPTSVLVLGALAVVTVAFVPGGLAGLAQRAMSRLAPTSAPVPAMSGASASAGFIDVDRARRFTDDPYAADDPFADDA
jgi:ABC-type branched-subunit amino acid transport system permease subunit